MRYFTFALILICLGTSSLFAGEPPKVEKQVVVFGKEGEFGAWPANHGMWNWGDEILVGLSTGTHKDLGPYYHNIDREKPENHVLARSLDGGETWTMEYPAEKGMLILDGLRHGIMPPELKEPTPVPLTEALDFTHPDFCMTLRFHDIHGGFSRFYYSYDRGHNWKGPFKLPLFDQPGIMARTDMIVNGKHDAIFMLSASKENEKEGRVICVRTMDGGLTWKFLSYVGPEPTGFSIMPATVRISDTELFTTTRRRENQGIEDRHRWIDAWRSTDNGKSWTAETNPVDDLGEGNPPALIKLQDGRLCLTYGVRKDPFEMQAKLSSDNGKTWSEPIVLHANGGGRDMGYPRSIQRPDGKIITTYYFYTEDDPYRKVYATIWDPGTP
ncbi:MAG: exo-alpha-sialidase [Planctomycetaceae bacterium]|nr:exo-alpha-sialidase [Planctomycetaceae bacterium]